MLLRRRSKPGAIARPADDEAALLGRLRAGDESAFMEVVDRYDGQLRRFARTFVRTEAVADEVVQEAWLGMLRGLEGFEGRSSLRTWLFRIVANQARTRAVRESRQIPFSSLSGADHEPSVDPSAFTDGMWIEVPARFATEPEGELLSAELRRQLTEAIDGLPERERIVVMLHDVAGLPGPEVAETLGISEGNQRVILHRARSRLRANLASYVGTGETG